MSDLDEIARLNVQRHTLPMAHIEFDLSSRSAFRIGFFAGLGLLTATFAFTLWLILLSTAMRAIDMHLPPIFPTR